MIGAVIYSGYLQTTVSGRQIHYVFVQANVTDPSKVPLAVWLNGGPGCSSLIGMVQEIGPFLVGNDYKLGDLLTKNEYSWAKVANLLFL
jgi:serine carboxypeptidase-like clade 2